MTTVLFNVRVDDDLDDAIKAAADSVGLKKSVWAREVLGAVALGGVTIEQLTSLVRQNGRQEETPHPARFLTLQAQEARRRVPGKCIHPFTARKNLPFTVLCGLCGQVVKRL